MLKLRGKKGSLEKHYDRKQELEVETQGFSLQQQGCSKQRPLFLPPMFSTKIVRIVAMVFVCALSFEQHVYAFPPKSALKRTASDALSDETLQESGAPGLKQRNVLDPSEAAGPSQKHVTIIGSQGDSPESKGSGESAASLRARLYGVREHYANPLTDQAFKHLLSLGINHDQSVAISFMNTFIPAFEKDPIIEIQEYPVAIPVFSDKRKKQVLMDFYVRTQRGERVIVEMQARRHLMFEERALFYATATYARQLSEEERKHEDWYRNLKPVYALQILNYDTNKARGIQDLEFEDTLVERVKEHPLPEGCYQKHYKMQDQNSGQTLDHLNLIQIELPRVREILFPPQKDFSIQQWWLSVLRHAKEYTPEMMEEWKDKMPESIQRSFERLDISVWDPEDVPEYARQRLDIDEDEALYQAGLAEARKKGLEEGREEGRKEGLKKLREVARNMVEKGMNDPEVSHLTGLSLEDVRQIRGESREERTP